MVREIFLVKQTQHLSRHVVTFLRRNQNCGYSGLNNQLCPSNIFYHLCRIFLLTFRSCDCFARQTMLFYDLEKPVLVYQCSQSQCFPVFLGTTLKRHQNRGLSGAFILSHHIQTCVQLLKSSGTYFTPDCSRVLIGLSLDI